MELTKVNQGGNSYCTTVRGDTEGGDKEALSGSSLIPARMGRMALRPSPFRGAFILCAAMCAAAPPLHRRATMLGEDGYKQWRRCDGNKQLRLGGFVENTMKDRVVEVWGGVWVKVAGRSGDGAPPRRGRRE